MANHSYWRIYITANNGASLLSIPEVEFRATVGGSDQASGGTAVYGTQNPNGNPDNLAAAAFDNDTGTKWTSNSNVPDYLGYHFASAVDVKEVSILGPTAGNGPTYAPKDFSIDYSDDGSTWTTVKGFTNETGWGAIEQRLFNLAL